MAIVITTLTDGNDVKFLGNDDDEVFGLGGDDFIAAGGGNDTLWGGLGDDTLTGSTGANELRGGGGIDTVLYAGASTFMYVDLAQGIAYSDSKIINDKLFSIEDVNGSSHGDFLIGDGKANRLSGLNGNDRLFGGAGQDTLLGGDGIDQLEGGSGADHLDGGNGDSDFANYQLSPEAVTIDLAAGTGSGGDAEGDSLIGIENIGGSISSDKLTGSGVNNSLFGGLGNDTILGMEGNDALYGSEGRDVLRGGAGFDLLVGNQGADQLYGGADADSAAYYTSSSGVAVNLATNVNSGGDAQGDKLFSIETILASDHNDTITGNGGANTLQGRNGNDVLKGAGGDDFLYGDDGNDTIGGGSGDDRIVGGLGKDRMSGGDGADIFEFNATAESGPAAETRDFITDFTAGVDRVDLHDVGGKAFIGQSAFSMNSGQVRFFYDTDDNTVIQLDTIGLGTSMMEIVLKGHIDLTLSDFIL